MADFSQQQLQVMAENAADKYNIPRDLFMALITQESGWNPHAVSSKGAQGLGQLMPGTAANLGVRNPFDPAQNLDGSARFFSQQLRAFGSENSALAAYNAGPGAVQQYGGVPPYKETQDYVSRIQFLLRPRYSGAGMGPTPSAESATNLSFLNTGPAPTPAHDLSFLNTGAPAPAPKAAAAPDLSFLSTPKPTPAPKSVNLSFLSTPKAAAAVAPAHDLSFLNVPQAPATPLFGGKAGPAPPGALSMPPGAAPLPGAVAPAGAALQAKQDVQAQENLGLPQKALNIVNTPISVASAFGNQLAKEIGKTHEAGGVQQGRVDAGVIFPELVKAIRNTPWAKTFVQGIKGESSQFPELLRSIGEGAPTSAVGKFTQQHPAVTTGLDFALSFPLLAATDSLQNEAVGLVGRGASALNRATGAGDKIISSIPGLQSMLQNGQTENALREVMGKNIAGFDRYYQDAAQAAEDARQTSQKYLHSGADIQTESPIVGKVSKNLLTGKTTTKMQSVNKLEELVADYMDAGNPGSKYGQPQFDQRASDRAYIALDILRQPQRLENAATIRQGFREGNMARSMFEGQSAAAQAAADTEWTNAAKSVLGETSGKPPALPGEKPLLSLQQRAASGPSDFSPGSRWTEPETGAVFEIAEREAPAGSISINVIRPESPELSAGPAFIRLEDLNSGEFKREALSPSKSTEAGHQALYEASLRQHEQEIRNLIQQAKLPPDQLADLQWELKERGAQFAQRALDMGESPGIAKEVAALEQRDVLRSKLAAKDQAALDAMERNQQARQATAAAQAAKESAQAQREHIGEVIQQGKIEMSAADRARNERTAANIKAGRDAANLNAGAAKAEALHERVKESLLYSGYDDLGAAAARANKGALRTTEIGQVAQDAAAHGIDMADVQRIGDQYSRIFDNLAQHLVDMQMMRPEAMAALKGQYLPRLYLMTKGQPGDIDAFLKFLDSEGALTPEAVAEAQKRGLAKTWQAGVGAKQFTQSRELTDFGARNDPALARALVPEATPAALHGIEAQTRAAGIASGMREIAQNPEWALPRESATLAHRQAGWADFPGKGPLAGMAVHPAVLRVLEEAKRPNVNRAVMHALLGPKLGEHVYQGNQVIRKAMLAGPSTMANVGVGHYYFAAAKAAEEGTHFTPLDYALAARDMRTAAKGGRVDPYLHEAMNETDLLSRGAGILPKEAKRVSGGVGLETPLQNVGRSLKAAGAKYLGATHDILAAGKFGLYRQLRKAGKSVDEAARMTRVATINYQGLPPAIRYIDNGMVAPFITFTYRAAPLAGRMAARSPGLFSLATGNRLNWYLDRMADRLDQARGLPGGAVALRQAGGVGPTTFALPGRHNAQGQQQYAQAPLLAPLLHHFGAGASITEPIIRQIRGLMPVASTAWQLALGLDLRGDTPRPIVPAGLPPGSDAEAAGERVKWIMHALVPPIAGLDRIKNAAQGTTAYAQSGLKPQTAGEAALQFLTGTRLGTAPALLPSRQTPPALSGAFTQARSDAALAEEKRSGGAVAGQAAMDRLSALFDKGSKDPDFVPNKGLADYAAKLSNPALRDALAAAKDRLPNVAFGEHYTGSDKVTETNRQIDFTYVLLHEADNPARNLHAKIRDELFPFNRTLGAVQSP